MRKKKASRHIMSQDDNKRCKELWLTGNYSTGELSELFNVSQRSIQRKVQKWGDPKATPIIPLPELTAEILRDDMAESLSMIKALRQELFKDTRFDTKTKLDMMLKSIEKIAEIEKSFTFMEGMGANEEEVTTELIRLLYRKASKRTKKEVIEFYGDIIDANIATQ